MSIAEQILKRIQSVTGADKVALHEPALTGNELRYVTDCIESGWVSSVGQYVERFERELAAYTGAAHAVAVSNGTSALQVALQLVGVQANDEVLVPALSFVATANAVRHCAAFPHFVDSSYATLGLDPLALDEHLRDIAELRPQGCFNRRSGRRIAAVVPMHTFGHPVDMPALLEVAERWQLQIVEDAAESLGSQLNGQHTGTFGRCAILSFNGNKIVTTGGGGAILSKDSELAKRAKHLTTTAKQPHPFAFFHNEVAYNYRMPNLNAAMGCAQLERLDEFLSAKRALTEQYAKAFSDMAEVSLFMQREGTEANYWLQTLLLASSVAEQRDSILEATNAAGQMTRPAWQLLPTLPMYQNSECMPIPVAENLVRRIINLPSSPQLVKALL